MKKFLYLLPLLLIPYLCHADSKVSNLTTVTAPAQGSYTYIINNGVGSNILWGQLVSITTITAESLIPTAVGQYYYCSNCGTVSTCVSTGTAAGALALITNKGSICQ